MPTARHKHCEHCGFEFEPKQQWERFCKQQCVEDYEKAHPPQIPNPNVVVLPGWNLPQPQPVITGGQYWYCGVCGQMVPANESHVHTFTVGG